MRKRVLYYDVLNIIATFGVVLLHSNGIAHTFTNSLAWYQALAVEVVFYWPVPVFFMLSGATLMNYRDRYTTADYLKRRALRTGIPFLAWSVICSFVYKVNPFEIGVTEYINRLFGTSILNVYWFFIPLFAIYLAMPVLSLLREHRRILWYMAGGTFLMTSLLPPLFSYVGLRWNGNLSFVMAGGYLLFTILGYLLSTEQLTRRKRVAIYLFGVLGVAIRYGGTVWLSLRDGTINKTFFNYLGYYSVFLAVAVFVWFRHSRIIDRIADHPRAVKLIGTVSGCSFGIYLMHIIVKTGLALFIDPVGWEWRLLVPFLIYGISLGVTYVLKKLPLLKHIVP